MKGAFCRAEWPFHPGLSLPGPPRGFPMAWHGAGRHPRGAWHCVHWGQPGLRGREVCAGAAVSALWLAEVLPLPAGLECAPRA